MQRAALGDPPPAGDLLQFRRCSQPELPATLVRGHEGREQAAGGGLVPRHALAELEMEEQGARGRGAGQDEQILAIENSQKAGFAQLLGQIPHRLPAGLQEQVQVMVRPRDRVQLQGQIVLSRTRIAEHVAAALQGQQHPEDLARGALQPEGHLGKRLRGVRGGQELEDVQAFLQRRGLVVGHTFDSFRFDGCRHTGITEAGPLANISKRNARAGGNRLSG